MSDTPYENLDIGYYKYPLPTTEEFQTVRFLNKEGLARLWDKVGDKFMRPPTGGTVGQAIIKTENGYSWGDSVPSGGTVGQVLTKTETGAEWQNIDIPDVPDIPEILPVTRGGTGCTTVDGIRTMLFNFPTEAQLDEYFNLV